jgi:hypothetical protein
MELKGILAISGEPGLYKMVKQSKNSIIVESITDGKRFPAYASAKISALEDIAIYTNDGDVQLGKVMRKIYEKEEGKATTVSHKADNKEIKAYFEQILPNYDQDRVYVSDMKRLLNWYNLLQTNNMLQLKDESAEEKTEAEQEEKTAE